MKIEGARHPLISVCPFKPCCIPLIFQSLKCEMFLLNIFDIENTSKFIYLIIHIETFVGTLRIHISVNISYLFTLQ